MTESPGSLATEDLLEQLCNASLVQSDQAGGGENAEMRFTLLETIREFASAKLPPEHAACLAAHHAAHFAGLARAAEPHLQSTDASAWMETLDRDHANLSAALDWAARTPTPEAARCGIQTATALHRYWLIRSACREGRARLDAALSHPCAAAGAWDQTTEATARNRAGVLAMTVGDAEAAEARYRETLALHKALNDRAGMASVLNNLSMLATNRGQLSEARALYLESLEICRALGDMRRTVLALGNLGGIDIESGSLSSARGFLRESIRLATSVGDNRSAAISLRNMGIVSYKEGNWASADQDFRETLAPLLLLGDERGCAYSLLCLGLTSQRQGRPRRALRLLTTALGGYAAFGQPLTSFARTELDRLAAAGLAVVPSAVAPGTATATAAIHAVTVLTQILLEDWGETENPAAVSGNSGDLILPIRNAVLTVAS